MTDKPPSKRLSQEQIWEIGCRGKQLMVDDQKRFAAMARNRFHTFELGVSHATNKDDDSAALGLICGLARELMDNPGLKKVWLLMAISRAESGSLVNLQLEKLQQTVH